MAIPVPILKLTKKKEVFSKNAKLEFSLILFIGIFFLALKSFDFVGLQMFFFGIFGFLYRYSAYKNSPLSIELNRDAILLIYEKKSEKIISISKVREILIRRTFMVIILNTLEKSLNVGIEGFLSSDIESLKKAFLQVRS